MMEPVKTFQYLSHRVVVYDSSEELKQAAAETITQYACNIVGQQSNFSMALAGGSTPVGVYELLVKNPYLEKFPWDQTKFLFGDERYVPHDHKQSNYRMAMQAFLNEAPVNADAIYPVPTDCDDQAECASRYEDTIKQMLSTNSLPAIDLILLGMGDDGHTASLFPDTDILKVADSAVAAVYVEKLKSWRISLTFPTLNNAGQVMVLVSGDSKAERLAEVLMSGTKKYPIQMVNNPNGMLWLIDRAAASGLS